MNILKHIHKPRKSCLICRVVGHKSPAEKPGRRELYPRELFVTNGPKKSANHERPAAWLWHTFPERTMAGGSCLRPVRSFAPGNQEPAHGSFAQAIVQAFLHKNECCTQVDPVLA